jgi:hypothetical protein
MTTPATATARAAAAAPGPAGGSGSRAGRPRAGQAGTGPGCGRVSRAWVAVVALMIVAGGALTALLTAPGPAWPLDPDSTAAAGGHALADLLAARGVTVIRAGTAGDAVTAARRAPATVLVTSPWQLTPAQLATVGRAPGALVIAGPGPQALRVLAPPVSVSGSGAVFPAAPGCGLTAARLAGRADLGGTLMQTSLAGASRCYGQHGQAGLGSGAALVQYRAGGRTITVLGAGTLMTNRELGNAGNAALALNLLSGSGRVVWLVPGQLPVAGGQAPAATGGRGLPLIPGPALLVAAELGTAVLLAALWRMRRFGPLVTEPMPVVVRASETTEGHARLYQSRRARARAATVLRATGAGRLLPRLTLPRAAPADVVCAELARRTGREAAAIEALLYGPAPADDAALVALATDLDTLEGEVLIT